MPRWREMRIPERRQVILAILEDQSVQDDTLDEHLAAMDEFISAIKASDEKTPEFERIKLREIEL